MLDRRALMLAACLLPLTRRMVGVAVGAEALPAPKDQVILRVSGAIARMNAAGLAEFDRPMLEALGLARLATWTPWTDGTEDFEGVLARDVLRAVGAHGTEVLATALNDFSASIPLSDFRTYDVILALRMNDKAMRVRDKGPIWIIYPWSDHPELDDLVTRRKSVWQLSELHVQ